MAAVALGISEQVLIDALSAPPSNPEVATSLGIIVIKPLQTELGQS
ncbi:MAG: hypothetical protein AAF267_09435 [Deinococcota bacterium]